MRCGNRCENARPEHSVAKAMDHMLRRRELFARFLDDGRICLTNDAAERALRGIALGSKSWLFAGSERSGVRAAAMYTRSAPPSSTTSIRRPGSPMSSTASRIRRRAGSTNSSPGTGSPSSGTIRPLRPTVHSALQHRHSSPPNSVQFTPAAVSGCLRYWRAQSTDSGVLTRVWFRYE